MGCFNELCGLVYFNVFGGLDYFSGLRRCGVLMDSIVSVISVDRVIKGVIVDWLVWRISVDRTIGVI